MGQRGEFPSDQRPDGALSRRAVLGGLVGVSASGCLGCGAEPAGRRVVAPLAPPVPARSVEKAVPAAAIAPHRRAPELVPPLFQRYPALGEVIPYVALGAWPTPVVSIAALNDRVGLSGLFVKRDDIAGTVYGGNKVRKLELVLEEARRQGRTEVLTFGGYGSNHAVATAAYARQLGLKAILNLVAEGKSERLTNALLADLKFGAEIRISGNAKTQQLMDELEAKGQPAHGPYVIAPGGSSTLGNVAFVNAAFELKDQVDAGVLPEPDIIYIALGSMGSAVGLALGLRAAGMKAKVVAVRTATPRFSSERKVQRLFKQLAQYLHKLDGSFPQIGLQPGDVLIQESYVGHGYAVPTTKGLRAMELVRDTSDLRLDWTYTAKTFAALVDDAPARRQETVLFWHTYNAKPVSLDGVDYRQLPHALQAYFIQGQKKG